MEDDVAYFVTQFDSVFCGNVSQISSDGDTGFNMTAAWSYLMTCLTVALAQQQIGLTNFTRGVQKEIQAAKNPIEQTLVAIGSKQCSNVKRIIGVEYEQIDNKSEPDLNKLSLKLFTPYYNSTYSLGEAARYIALDPQFNMQGDLVIFIHGFTDDPTKDSFSNISSAFSFIDQGNNVMALDGSSLIQSLYLRSTTYIRFMGERLGETLAVMIKDGLSPKRIHIIGHSLGAHIAGFTGRHFQQKTGKLLGRISGLDPAGPCFSDIDPDLRLSYKYAEYVDVIHTDGGVYGIKTPLGHADYFPNSGEQQPDCLFQTCSHSRAWLLYTESIVNSTALPAVACADWAAFKKGNCDYDNTSYMGYASKPSTRGLYFLQTGEDAPYGLYQAGLYYKDNEAILSKVGQFLTGNEAPSMRGLTLHAALVLATVHLLATL